MENIMQDNNAQELNGTLQSKAPWSPEEDIVLI
jgi:hypothetical protein